MMTHPSTVRRAMAIGRAAEISEERVRELLAAPALDGVEAGPQEFYPLPDHAVADGKVFSTLWKQRFGVRIFLAYMAFSIALPVLLLRGLDLAGWSGSGFLAFLLVQLLTGVGALALSNFLPFAGNRRLCALLREKLAAKGLPAGPPDGMMVGLSPGAVPRIFESNYSWDTGSLVIERDRLCYWGEETRFALARNEVASLRTGPGFPSWFRARFLYVTARNADGRAYVFNLRPFDVRSALGMKRSLADLERRLKLWQSDPFSGAPPSLLDPGPFRVGEVTSSSPGDVGKPGQALTLVILVALLAGFVASLAKLPLEWVAPPPYASDQAAREYAGISGWYAILASTLSMLVFFGPLWFARRRREPSLEPVPPVPVEGSRRISAD